MSEQGSRQAPVSVTPEEVLYMLTSLRTFKVNQLKELCKSLAFPTSGRKQVLIDRVCQFVEYTSRTGLKFEALALKAIILKTVMNHPLPPFAQVVAALRSGVVPVKQMIELTQNIYTAVSASNPAALRAPTDPVSHSLGHMHQHAAPSHTQMLMSSGPKQHTPGFQQEDRYDGPMLLFRSTLFYTLKQMLGSVQVLRASKGRCTKQFFFRLSDAQLSLLRSNASYKIYLFSGAESTKDANHTPILFPPIEIYVDGVLTKQYLRGIKGQAGTSRPADLTPYVARELRSNVLRIVYSDASERFLIYMYIVQEHSPAELIKEISMQSPHVAYEATVANIKKEYEETDDDIVIATSLLSLRCPITYARMKNPTKSLQCDHIQCFDGESFLIMQQRIPSWQCPICSKAIQERLLAISDYVRNILENTLDEIDSVTLNKDGSWTAVHEDDADDTESDDAAVPHPQQKEETKREEMIEIISLDSDSEDEMESAIMNAVQREETPLQSETPVNAQLPSQQNQIELNAHTEDVLMDLGESTVGDVTTDAPHEQVLDQESTPNLVSDLTSGFTDAAPDTDRVGSISQESITTSHQRSDESSAQQSLNGTAQRRMSTVKSGSSTHQTSPIGTDQGRPTTPENSLKQQTRTEHTSRDSDDENFIHSRRNNPIVISSPIEDDPTESDDSRPLAQHTKPQRQGPCGGLAKQIPSSWSEDQALGTMRLSSLLSTTNTREPHKEKHILHPQAVPKPFSTTGNSLPRLSKEDRSVAHSAVDPANNDGIPRIWKNIDSRPQEPRTLEAIKNSQLNASQLVSNYQRTSEILENHISSRGDSVISAIHHQLSGSVSPRNLQDQASLAGHTREPQGPRNMATQISVSGSNPIYYRNDAQHSQADPVRTTLSDDTRGQKQPESIRQTQPSTASYPGLEERETALRRLKSFAQLKFPPVFPSLIYQSYDQYQKDLCTLRRSHLHRSAIPQLIPGAILPYSEATRSASMPGPHRNLENHRPPTSATMSPVNRVNSAPAVPRHGQTYQQLVSDYSNKVSAYHSMMNPVSQVSPISQVRPSGQGSPISNVRQERTQQADLSQDKSMQTHIENAPISEGVNEQMPLPIEANHAAVVEAGDANSRADTEGSKSGTTSTHVSDAAQLQATPANSVQRFSKSAFECLDQLELSPKVRGLLGIEVSQAALDTDTRSLVVNASDGDKGASLSLLNNLIQDMQLRTPAGQKRAISTEHFERDWNKRLNCNGVKLKFDVSEIQESQIIGIDD